MRKVGLFIAACAFIILAPRAEVGAVMTEKVPLGHWAYESIQELAREGLIADEEARNFSGEKAVNRFDIASAFVKALAKIEEKAKEKDFKLGDLALSSIETLAVGFSDELSVMAVKYRGIATDLADVKEDISKLKLELASIKGELEKNGEKVKIGGDYLTRITDLHCMHGLDGVHNTAQLFRFRFMMNIDEDVKAVARWRILNGIGNSGTFRGKNQKTGILDLAFLQIKNKLGGDFLLGRTFDAPGHSLLINQYVDVARYTTSKDGLIYQANAYFRRKKGKDTNQIWNLGIRKNKKSGNCYVNLYAQTGPNGYNMVAKGNDPAVKDSSRYDAEIGSSGDLGKSGKLSYDFSAVFTKLKQDYVNPAIEDLNDSGSIAYAALNWEANKEIKSKLAYYYADEKAHGGLFLGGDRRLANAPETPLEDITRLDNLMYTNYNFVIDKDISNFQDIKIQMEYKPLSKPKHYFRLAYDILSNLNDNKKYTNPLGTEEGKANVLTAEYRYRISKSLTWKNGFTKFTYDGWTDNTHTVKAGRGTILEGTSPKDKDFRLFWSELYTKF